MNDDDVSDVCACNANDVSDDGGDVVGVLGGCDWTCSWDRPDAYQWQGAVSVAGESVRSDDHYHPPPRHRRLPASCSRTCHVLPGTAPARLLPGDGRHPPQLQSPGHAASHGRLRRWLCRSQTVRVQIHRSTALLINVGSSRLITEHVNDNSDKLTQLQNA